MEKSEEKNWNYEEVEQKRAKWAQIQSIGL